ncbi:hypothetical protein EJQ19_11230 [Paenibacillus whitsoniae]|uniref:Uncharacterized protein n=1 Tax=Paenibacillus whitsoniae TaxID=2496558 RepID=A0A3S0CAJ6_9BACL|nr:hypothetical protein EJQ19_11230 [Paenibacillus whitsoniae]
MKPGFEIGALTPAAGRAAAAHVPGASRIKPGFVGAAGAEQQFTFLVLPDKPGFAIGAPAPAAGPSVCSSRT